MASHKKKKEVKQREDAIIRKYNVELLKCIDEMRSKRDEVHKDILALTQEQGKLESDVLQLTRQLTRINEGLCLKLKQRQECDDLIKEYDEAFQKILYGQETLLSNVRRAVQTVAPSVILEESEPEQSVSSRQAMRSSRLSSSMRMETRTDTHRDSKTDMSRQESRADSK